jgi:hypothetical protein
VQQSTTALRDYQGHPQHEEFEIYYGSKPANAVVAAINRWFG